MTFTDHSQGGLAANQHGAGADGLGRQAAAGSSGTTIRSPWRTAPSPVSPAILLPGDHGRPHPGAVDPVHPPFVETEHRQQFLKLSDVLPRGARRHITEEGTVPAAAETGRWSTRYTTSPGDT